MIFGTISCKFVELLGLILNVFTITEMFVIMVIWIPICEFVICSFPHMIFALNYHYSSLPKTSQTYIVTL